MMRRKADELRDTLTERDSNQATITSAASEAICMVRDAGIEREIIDAIEADLGDLLAESLKVTQ